MDEWKMNSKEIKELKELLDLLKERGVSEFELERGKQKIRIKRESGSQTDAASRVAAASYVPAVAPLPSAPPAEAAPPEYVPEPSSGEVFIVKSPMVGTFYRAPNPNAPPFAAEGDVVEVGQVLCIVEAMKLMNEIESEVAGEVIRAYVENGKPVEYNQSLFAVKRSHKK